MRHRQAALGHHLHQVSQAQLEAKIPGHAQDDNFAVEVATLEQLLHALQLYHCRPSASSAASIADRIAPFAPEPQSVRSAYAGYRFPPEIIRHAVCLYFRFPLSLRTVY